MSHGYLFKFYQHRAPADYIPSMIGKPISGAAQPSYYERIDMPDRTVTALSRTNYVVEGTDDPILQVRHPSSKLYYLPLSEIEAIAAEHQDDATFTLLAGLFGRRVS